jgi:DNA replication protein DnaC
MDRVNVPELPGWDPNLPFVEPPPPTPEEIAETRRRHLFESAGIPPRYAAVTDQVRLPGQSDEWNGEPWALTILGPAGTGKTWIAVRLLMKLYDGFNLRRYATWPKFLDVSTAIESIKSEFGTDNDGKTLDALMNSCLLVLDDLGAERETDFTKDRVSAVLRSRYNQMLPTIITSNATNLGELGDQRIASRLSDGLVITLNGKDRRGKNP